jgi:hypothetical protein
MKNYESLEIGSFYLIIENEGENVSLVEPLMETNNAVLLMHHDDVESTFWRKKADPIFELVDELTEDQLDEYDALVELDEDFDIMEEDNDLVEEVK